MALMTAPTAASMLASMAWLTVTEAATRYPLSARQIRNLINDKKVAGKRVGFMWTVDERSLARYLASERKPGPRPK